MFSLVGIYKMKYLIHSKQKHFTTKKPSGMLSLVLGTFRNTIFLFILYNEIQLGEYLYFLVNERFRMEQVWIVASYLVWKLLQEGRNIDLMWW